MKQPATLFLRVGFGDAGAIGPGKIRLLELIGEHESISAAGRAMEMSYKQAWKLVDEMNACCVSPVVTAQTGGRRGGGATVTKTGQALVKRYRRMEARAQKLLAADLAKLGEL